VGARIKTYVWIDEVSISYKALIANAAVLPVPDYA